MESLTPKSLEKVQTTLKLFSNKTFRLKNLQFWPQKWSSWLQKPWKSVQTTKHLDHFWPLTLVSFVFSLQQFLNPKGGCSTGCETGCKPVLFYKGFAELEKSFKMFLPVVFFDGCIIHFDDLDSNLDLVHRPASFPSTFSLLSRPRTPSGQSQFNFRLFLTIFG